MTRRGWLAAALVAPAVAADTYDVAKARAHGQDILALAVALDDYMRQLFGCPDRKDWRAEMCEPAKGHVDASAFLRCRKLARRAFDL